jgi:hypothetical protein
MHNQKDIDETVKIVDRIERQQKRTNEEAEKRRGEAGRKHFASYRARLVKALDEVNGLRSNAAKARGAVEKLLRSGVQLLARDREALNRVKNNLLGPAGQRAAEGIKRKIDRIDNLGDDPQFWPKENFAAAELANVGAASQNIELAISLVKKYKGALVRPQEEVEDPPWMDEERSGENLEVVGNYSRPEGI